MSESRNIPISELDATFMTIDPAWGKEVSQELNEKLQEANKGQVEKDEHNNFIVKKSYLWGLLSYYTRDMRLSNLNADLFVYCQKYLDFAGDCLRENYIQSFMCALSRVITALELAQSRNGFLRRRSNTITTEKYENPIDPQKKTLFGNNKQDRGGYK